MRSFISKLFGMMDVSKKYIVPENRKQDTLDSTIVVNKDDTNYIAELHVFKILLFLRAHALHQLVTLCRSFCLFLIYLRPLLISRYNNLA